MSFSDPSGPFDQPMQQFEFGDPNDYWSQFALGADQLDSNSHGLTPPLKRPRSSEENPSIASRRSPLVNRGTSNIFFKTRMCAKFKSGTCRNGENCNFAHGIEDLRQPPPNWQDIVGTREEDHRSSLAGGNWDDDQKIIHRMKLCKKFYNGEECPYGDRCNFLHEDPAKFRDDSGQFRETSAICIGTTTGISVGHANGSIPPDGSRTNGSIDGRGNSKPVYWKTKLCTKWDMTGHCPFGEKCHFAHGQAELQAPGIRLEGEAALTASLPTTPQVFPAVDQSITAPSNDPLLSDERRIKKNLLRWKGHRKIDKIYGDWLEGLPIGQQEPDSSKHHSSLQ